jgi:DNA adenine methylase
VNAIDSKPQAQPLVKWAGGKRQLQERILATFPAFTGTYFEPFLGGAAIFFALNPKKAVLSDVNQGLVNLYKCVQDDYLAVLAEAQKLEKKYNKLDLDEQSDLFYKTRESYNSSERKGLKNAVDFLLLNKAGFNGIYRENASGGFNVPFGKRSNLVLVTASNLELAAKSLQKARISIQGFEKVVSVAKAGDLVYFDPPYVPLSITSAFTSYSKGGFGEAHQVELSRVFKELSDKGVHVALSNSKTPLVEKLYKGFKHHELSATRQISAKTAGRNSVTELLVTNF